METDLIHLAEKELIELVPFNVAVIDQNYNVVNANGNFEEYFGKWDGRRCYEVCKNLQQKCSHCKAEEVFRTGEMIVSDEAGISRNGDSCHYVVHMAPLKDENGKVAGVVEMSFDVTRPSHLQKEYNMLFERVPCYISIIDRNFKVVRANEKFRKKFGESRGKFCYQLYKKRENRCSECPAALTFNDGQEHVATQRGLSKSGEETTYIVTTTPLSRSSDNIPLVMEIATDITELDTLQVKLRRTSAFFQNLVLNATDGIIAINRQGEVEIFNRAARNILGWTDERIPKITELKEHLPEEFFSKADKDGEICRMHETRITTESESHLPVRFNAIELRSGSEVLGRVAFIQDLRPIMKLEKEKLNAERLGAVGETVAGLAHTIKNVLMGLEGGMYMVDTGLKKGNAKRIYEGWDVLQKNFDKTTQLVRGFLNFAKGRLPELKLIEPAGLVRDIVELYHDAAQKQGVELTAEIEDDVKKAYLDPDGIEACLTNLVSNAIDAAVMGDSEKKKVVMKVLDENNELLFKVSDNGTGMDSEVIQKIFTTFFTTKGNKGTGLGLLTTNKIVKEHGGKISVDSDLGEGSTFSIRFNRTILEMLAAEIEDLK